MEGVSPVYRPGVVASWRCRVVGGEGAAGAEDKPPEALPRFPGAAVDGSFEAQGAAPAVAAAAPLLAYIDGLQRVSNGGTRDMVG